MGCGELLKAPRQAASRRALVARTLGGACLQPLLLRSKAAGQAPEHRSTQPASMAEPTTEEVVRILFDRVDTNGSGRLEPDEVHTLIQQLEMKISPRKLHAAIAEMDSKGLGFISFPSFAKWWAKQAIGHRLTKQFLWTPRGTRISLNSPRFGSAMQNTGVAVHNMKAPTELQLKQGNPTPEVKEMRREGMERIRTENIKMVLDERTGIIEALEEAADEKKVVVVDDTTAKIEAMIAQSAERIEGIMAAQKAREAAAEAEMKRMHENAKDRDERAAEQARVRAMNNEERAAEHAIERTKKEEKTNAIKAKLAAELERKELERDAEAAASMSKAETRARNIARKRQVEERRKVEKRERLTAIKAARVAALQEAEQLARVEAAEEALEKDIQRIARIQFQKEEEQQAKLARNNEKREALEARLNISAGDAISREQDAQEELARKLAYVEERNANALRVAEERRAGQRALAAKANAERGRKAKEREAKEERRIVEAKAALVVKAENVVKAQYRALLATQSKVERSKLDALEKANFVERMQRMDAVKQAKMREQSDASDVKTREWYEVRTSLKERQSKQMISLLLNDYQENNPLYKGGKTKRSSSVPVGVWESKRGWDLHKPNPSGQSATGHFDKDGEFIEGNGRTEEEEALRRRHGVGDRSEWEADFMNKYGREELSPSRNSLQTMNAGKHDAFGITGGRNNRIRQSMDVGVRIDRSKVFNQSWSVDSSSFGR